MNDDDGIGQILEIRDLGGKGCEIIVSVVNQLETPLYVRGGTVEITKDGRDLGRHALSFDHHDGKRVELDQFEIAHGRFHVEPDGGIHDLRCVVHLDCSRGDGVQTTHISRRIKTGQFRRPS